MQAVCLKGCPFAGIPIVITILITCLALLTRKRQAWTYGYTGRPAGAGSEWLISTRPWSARHAQESESEKRGGAESTLSGNMRVDCGRVFHMQACHLKQQRRQQKNKIKMKKTQRKKVNAWADRSWGERIVASRGRRRCSQLTCWVLMRRHWFQTSPKVPITLFFSSKNHKTLSKGLLLKIYPSVWCVQRAHFRRGFKI